MKNWILIILSSLIVFGCEEKEQSANNISSLDFVFVKGGRFVNQKSNLYGKNALMSDFYIATHEVTQGEWSSIMNDNPSKFKGENLPIEMVSWYDCIAYCIKRSNIDELSPYYSIDSTKIDPSNQSEYDSIKWIVSVNTNANGYRLPTEAEWEYAASGGQLSNNYTFSGGDELDEVAWYWRNSGDSILTGAWSWKSIKYNHCRTNPVGQKLPNELGVFDMTGNVREWCQDWFVDYNYPQGLYRSQRGGGWMGVEIYNSVSERGNFEASGQGSDQGFRLCRNI
ncbi:MAG: formylglycine-generating enzyme family protein [Reichenbachiella sp.]